MKSKIQLVNPCLHCGGKGFLTSAEGSEEKICGNCRGDGEVSEWCSIEDVFHQVNRTLYYRTRLRNEAI
ncbi:MAG: hypothetical protein ACXWQ5_00705 [Ktedonobacterales bacterium]